MAPTLICTRRVPLLRCGRYGVMHCVWRTLRMSALATVAQAQAPARGVFDPLPLPAASAIRTDAGTPGDKYWQQRVNYRITAQLDTAKQTIVGDEEIQYENRSPDTLRTVWLQLDQNLFASGAPSSVPIKPTASGNFAGGFQIGRITERTQNGVLPLTAKTTGTVMRADLTRPLAPGKTTFIQISYSFLIPEDGVNRMGRRRFAGGWTYTIGQWYPRLAVYDDIRGWNLDPYLGQGEFYLEFGGFDVAITVPSGFTVAATGELQNSIDVLTSDERTRLEAARRSDSTIRVRVPNRPASSSPRCASGAGHTCTWRFHADSVRDFAWAASSAFTWDATGGDGILFQSFYNREASADWRYAADYMRKTILLYSHRWIRYPYSTATSVAAPQETGGMEYPMIIFNPHSYSGRALKLVTLHEGSHQWFPIIVGSNERRYAWMDEGLATFIDNVDDWSDAGYPPRGNGDGWARIVRSGRDGIPMLPADSIPNAVSELVSYDKPAMALYLLRSQVFPDTASFDRTFMSYATAWRLKHPTPADFFRAMERGLGQDLSWFWRGWFYSAELLDQAVDSVHVDSTGRPGSVSTIYLSNRRGLVMPVRLRLTLQDGTTREERLPVDVWRNGNSAIHSVRSSAPITRVEVDPDHNVPDVDRGNNQWPRQG